MSDLSFNIQKEWKKDNFDLQQVVEELEKMVKKIPKEDAELFRAEINDSEFIKNLKLFARGCEAFQLFLNKAQKTQTGWNYKTYGKNSPYKNREIIRRGTALIFQLRTFLTGHKITFLIGGTAGSNTLKEKEYSQDLLFGNDLSNLYINLNKGEVELSSALEKLNSLEDSNGTLSQQWANIINYALVKNYKTEGEPYGSYESSSSGSDENKQHIVYKKSEADISVYYKWVKDNKKNRLDYYYNFKEHFSQITSKKDFQDMRSYDRGWLYQWGKIKEHEDNLIIETGLKPLHEFMKTSFRENVPGIRGGDYIKGTLNEQYKYTSNSRIITITNIKNLLNGGGRGSASFIGIIPSIKNFLNASGKEEQIENLSSLLVDFTSYNKEELTNFVNEKIDGLLEISEK